MQTDLQQVYKGNNHVAMSMKKIGYTIFIFVIFISVFTVLIRAEPTNDTWHDTHWGGDTGEEEFTEPPKDEGTRGGGGLCSSGMIVMGVCVPAKILQMRKKNAAK